MLRESTATVSEVTGLARLKGVLAEDAGTALGVALREVCGGIEVRVSAATAVLRLFVDRADRRFDLPVLYRNSDFVVYDLR